MEHWNVGRRIKLALWEPRGTAVGSFSDFETLEFPMSEHDSVNQEGDDKGLTSPDADHPGEATSPPGNQDTDEQAVEEGRDRLDQAGGGH
jgi:hypothetical protein